MSGVEPTWARFLEALPVLYRDPILTAMAAGAVLGFLGVYVVTRRMVFISAALSQLAGVGVALAFFVPMLVGDLGGWGEPTLWALAASLAGALFLRLDPARIGLTRDGLLGLTYVVAGAVALILGSRIAQEAHDIKAILFGTAVAVRTLDLWLTVGVGGTILLLHLLVVRGLAAASFDPVGSAVQGLPVRALDAFLYGTVAVAVAITTRALGALPVFAFTVLPAMGALALSRRLPTALALGAMFGAVSAALGYVYSFFLRLPVGASQAAVAGALCLIGMGLRVAASREVRVSRRVAAMAGGAVVLLIAVSPFLTAGEPEEHSHGHGHDEASTAPAASAAALTKLLTESADPAERAEAAHRLGHVAVGSACDALAAALADEDWSVRAEAAEALGHGACPTPPALIRALREDKSAWVRVAAATALCHASDESARKALAEAAANDPDPSVRAACARHLAD